MTIIRTITMEEAEPFWRLRLEALQTNPEAFGRTYEEASRLTNDAIRGRLAANENQFVLGAYDDDGSLVGMAGLKRETAVKMSHKAMIWGMYVSPGCRKQKIGHRLLQEIMSRAKEMAGLEQVTLAVVTGNEQARNLYLSMGFEVYGRERNALKHNGISYDEELMVYFIQNS
ncbi:GNAT family N-acetyltransferase [Paenibacillus soyae]|uniref:GNAT family N-acetyltransferase n=1 Tax=Paenibacillus soyae TaxID=2969249 RepID=A0A9X2MN84_9BACL|nr:GNAT family N-acetyltransferase [Paenibacillus soyae]MCR2802771.1 GNAT family N-acetyltransferase [Paenibacillus soyae]